MNGIIVYKLDADGRQVWQYPAAVLQRTRNYVRLEAFFNREDLDLGFVVFKEGDRFVEYFYNDRWYNVFAVYDRDDAGLKGWYCNICRPAELSDSAVRCEDLALDLWATAGGDMVVLDENEFAILDLSPQDREKGLKAMTQLTRMAAEGKLPK